MVAARHKDMFARNTSFQSLFKIAVFLQDLSTSVLWNVIFVSCSAFITLFNIFVLMELNKFYSVMSPCASLKLVECPLCQLL